VTRKKKEKGLSFFAVFGVERVTTLPLPTSPQVDLDISNTKESRVFASAALAVFGGWLGGCCVFDRFVI
jgi:hypothetical protein